MRLFDYIRNFKGTITKLRESKTKRAVGVAMSVLAQTKKRIQDTGRNYEGGQFAPYSKLYEVQRVKDGYQSGFVDFTRRGRLWNSINPFVERDERYRTVVVLRPRDRENQTKLNAQAGYANRGNILIPSSDELRFAVQVWERGALKLLNRIR